MSDEQQVRKKRRKLRGYHILILALLVGIAWFGLSRWRQKRQLKTRIEAIRAAGYPVTLAELDDWYSIPEGVENAAYTLIDAFSCYPDANKVESRVLAGIGKAEFPGRGEDLPEDVMRVVAKYLDDNQDALALLREGAAIKDCRYPMDLKRTDVPLVHLTDIRKSVMRLRLDSIIRIDNGQDAEALDSVISIFGLVRSLDREPFIVSYFVRGWSVEMGVISLERLVNRVELTEEQLGKIADVIYEAEKASDVSCGIAGSRVADMTVFRSPESVEVIRKEIEDGDKWPHPAVLQVRKAIGLLDKTAIVYLDLMAEFMEITEFPEHERQEAAVSLKNKLEKTHEVHSIIRLLTPKFADSFIVSDLRRTAQLRAAYTSLAVERYRLAVGELPESLGGLVPAYLDSVPRDPFDGAELRYKRLENGYVVYSIGENGSDDGGRERLPREERKDPEGNWDVTFIVER